MSCPEKIEEAVERHLAADLYHSADGGKRQKAVDMAQRDILCQTGENIDRESDLFYDAVAEQTIFLLLNLEKINAPLNDVVSESVEGAGSVTYDRSADAPLISPRALQLCRALTRKTLALKRG